MIQNIQDQKVCLKDGNLESIKKIANLDHLQAQSEYNDGEVQTRINMAYLQHWLLPRKKIGWE